VQCGQVSNCSLLSSLQSIRPSRLIGCADTEDISSFVLFAALLSNGDGGDAFVEREWLFSGLFTSSGQMLPIYNIKITRKTRLVHVIIDDVLPWYSVLSNHIMLLQIRPLAYSIQHYSPE